MKLSDIISKLEALRSAHGEMDFYIEAIETDDGSTIIGNDFVKTEVIEFEEFKSCVMTVETLAVK